MPVGSHLKCAVNLWAANLQVKPKLVMCSACKVHLCINCFEIFHNNESDLVKKKAKIGKHYLNRKHVI